MRFVAEIMDTAAIRRAVIKISNGICERNKQFEDVALIGIQRRGVCLAQKIKETLDTLNETNLLIGDIDISLHRDDLSKLVKLPTLRGASIPFAIEGKHIVLVDDVLFTGRTCRAAMEAIIKMGRPQSIQLAVLIDRGHKEMPIKADFVGRTIATQREQLVSVNFKPIDQKTNVELFDLL